MQKGCSLPFGGACVLFCTAYVVPVPPSSSLAFVCSYHGRSFPETAIAKTLLCDGWWAKWKRGSRSRATSVRCGRCLHLRRHPSPKQHSLFSFHLFFKFSRTLSSPSFIFLSAPDMTIPFASPRRVFHDIFALLPAGPMASSLFSFLFFLFPLYHSLFFFLVAVFYSSFSNFHPLMVLFFFIFFRHPPFSSSLITKKGVSEWWSQSTSPGSFTP